MIDMLHVCIGLTGVGWLLQNGRKQWVYCIRAVDPRLCGISAVAMLLFVRWLVQGEPRPTFAKRADW
jgi:hypothetical protein